MKFLLKYVLPVLAIVWLAKVHPLGAVVAVLLCVVRCAFKSGVFSHLFALFVHDVIVAILRGFWRLVFLRRRS
jgi:hypothetical protein